LKNIILKPNEKGVNGEGFAWDNVWNYKEKRERIKRYVENILG